MWNKYDIIDVVYLILESAWFICPIKLSMMISFHISQGRIHTLKDVTGRTKQKYLPVIHNIFFLIKYAKWISQRNSTNTIHIVTIHINSCCDID